MTRPSPRTERELADLSSNLRPRVRALIVACPTEITITSAWRSREEQQRLYDGWKRREPGYNPANPPGMSRHEDTAAGQPAANAADLGFTSADARSWAHAHAARFGLHFPIGREPWHAEATARPFTPTDTEDDEMTPEQDARLKRIEAFLDALTEKRRADKADADPNRLSLADLYTQDERKHP